MTMNHMTLNQKYYLGTVAVIPATLAGTLVAYPQLHSIVPILMFYKQLEHRGDLN
jgi:hypothetical protein